MVEAKVNMIRDAQCAEKQIIKKEVDTEEKRLDHEMEVDRVNAIRIEEEIARKRKNERMIGAMMIMDQIKHNEQVTAVYKTVLFSHQLLGSHTYSVRAVCFGRRISLSVCRLSVPRQMSKIRRDRREISSPL